MKCSGGTCELYSKSIFSLFQITRTHQHPTLARAHLPHGHVTDRLSRTKHRAVQGAPIASARTAHPAPCGTTPSCAPGAHARTARAAAATSARGAARRRPRLRPALLTGAVADRRATAATRPLATAATRAARQHLIWHQKGDGRPPWHAQLAPTQPHVQVSMRSWGVREQAEATCGREAEGQGAGVGADGAHRCAQLGRVEEDATCPARSR